MVFYAFVGLVGLATVWWLAHSPVTRALLRGHGTDPGLCPRDDRTYGKVPALCGDSQVTSLRVQRYNREGIHFGLGNHPQGYPARGRKTSI